MIKKKKFQWITKNFKNFLYNFSFKNHHFKYRELIRVCSLTNKKIFEIHLDDLEAFDNELYLFVRMEPIHCLNCFEFVINSLVRGFVSVEFRKQRIISKIQIIVLSKENPIMFKNLNSDNINKLVKFKILVLSVSRNKVKISQLKNRTINKKTKKTSFISSINTKNQIENVRFDKNLISYEKLELNKNNFVDCQIIKAQDDLEKKTVVESSGHLLFFLERELVGKISVGKIIEVTGIFLLNNFCQNKTKKSFRNNYYNRETIIHIIGFQNFSQLKKLNYLRKEILFDDDFLIFAKSGNAYDWIVSSIAPDFFGQDDAKAGIACSIVGGTSNVNCSRLRFDGQINVLLVGNNSEFKEKLLGFIKEISQTYLEENILSNDLSQAKETLFGRFPNQINLEIENKKFTKRKGIYFIKEIDKISFFQKTEVFRMLNKDNISFFEKKNESFYKSKISLLAGIDDITFKECLEKNRETYNIDPKTISNFDLIFSIDKKLDNQGQRKNIYDVTNLPEKNYTFCDNFARNNISLKMIKQYIRFVQRNFNPVLTKASADFLKDVYLQMRTTLRKKPENFKTKQLDLSVRQLESIIKLSESLGRIKMRKKIFMTDALEAVRLFKKRFIF